MRLVLCHNNKAYRQKGRATPRTVDHLRELLIIDSFTKKSSFAKFVECK